MRIREHRGIILALLVSLGAFVGLPAAKRPELRVRLAEGEVRVLEFSPDSRLLFTEGDSGACLRDADSGRVRVKLTGAGGRALGSTAELAWPRFTPDGRRLIVQLGGSRSRFREAVTLKVFDVETGRQRASFAGVGWRGWWGSSIHPPEYVLSADGSTLAFTHGPDQANNRVMVWDVVRERTLAEFPGAPPLALTPDGKTLAYRVSGSDRYRFAIRGVGAEQPGATFVTGPLAHSWDGPTSLAFSPDGTLLAVGYFIASEVRDAATGRISAVLGSGISTRPISPQAVRFSPDSRRLCLERWGDDDLSTVLQWWERSGASWREVVSGPPVGFTPDGRRAAIATFNMASRWDPLSRNNSVVTVTDLASRRQRARIVETGVRVATISPDGRVVAMPAFRREGPFRLRPPPFVRLPPFVNRMMFRRSLRGTGPLREVREIKFYEAATGRPLGAIDRSDRRLTPDLLMFSPDSKTLVIHETPRAGSPHPGLPVAGRSVELWDVPPVRPIGRILALWCLVAVSLVLGRWLDRRRAGRAASATNAGT